MKERKRKEKNTETAKNFPKKTKSLRKETKKVKTKNEKKVLKKKKNLFVLWSILSHY